MEITDDERELDIYIFKDTQKKEREQIKNDIILAKKLIRFCIKHFDDYGPDFRKACGKMSRAQHLYYLSFY